MDVDCYITDENAALVKRLPEEHRAAAAAFLIAALPGILTAHRADVLREAAETFDPTGRSVDELTRSAVAHALRRIADEAVAP